ncbi:DUF1439 domain-containing protein [Vibrio maerlii]|uniref:DUF1439 domain-containing protein n=1 Tax=Vibrio maerlii TaxID=2231648 RepID=UPI000E3C99D0|nr:DUF1439 domain-containing protein [Vibrio maerlii]
MISRFSKLFAVITSFVLLGGCASYSITEQEMTSYLTDNIAMNQSVGVQPLLYAEVSVDDLEVKIGRADADRISVFANTTADVQMYNTPNKSLDLDIEFSAVPEYNKDTGEIFLKSLKLERFEEKSGQLPSNLVMLLEPAVSTIGYALSQQPAYKLDSSDFKQSLLKSAEPNLVIKGNKLVIDLLD